MLVQKDVFAYIPKFCHKMPILWNFSILVEICVEIVIKYSVTFETIICDYFTAHDQRSSLCLLSIAGLDSGDSKNIP